MAHTRDVHEPRSLARRGEALAYALDPRPTWHAGRAAVSARVDALRSQGLSYLHSPEWSRMAHTAALTALAVTISISVGLASAATVTPWFLRLALPANNVVGMFTQLPFIGPILTGIIQRGGPFGALCSSLVLWFGTRAMFSQGTLQDRRWDWGLAAAAVGVALSPIFVPGVAVTGALATACLTGAVALSYLASRAHLPQGLGDWRINALAIAIGLAFAPMGAQAAMLTPPVAIMGEALTITMLCTLGIAVHGVVSLLAPLFRENIAVRQTEGTGGAAPAVLDLPGNEGRATVFGTANVSELCDVIENIQEDINENIANPARLIVLRGPPGSGKWSLANALIGSLDIPMERPYRETFQASGFASGALETFFKKCKERAQITRRPVAIMIKDLDHLFAQRGQGDTVNDQMVNASLKYLEQIEQSKESNLIIVATLNSKSTADGAVTSRNGNIFTEVPTPSMQNLANLVTHRIRHILSTRLPAEMCRDLPEAAWAPWHFTAEALGAQAFEMGLNGRDMSIYAQRLSDNVRAALRRSMRADGASADKSSLLIPQLCASHQGLWRQHLEARTGHTVHEL